LKTPCLAGLFRMPFFKCVSSRKIFKLFYFST